MTGYPEKELFEKLGRIAFMWSGMETASATMFWAVSELEEPERSAVTGALLSIATTWDAIEELLEARTHTDLLEQFREWEEKADDLRAGRNHAIHSQWAISSGPRWRSLDVGSRRTKQSGPRIDVFPFDQLDTLAEQIEASALELGQMQAEVSRRRFEAKE